MPAALAEAGDEVLEEVRGYLAPLTQASPRLKVTEQDRFLEPELDDAGLWSAARRGGHDDEVGGRQVAGSQGAVPAHLVQNGSEVGLTIAQLANRVVLRNCVGRAPVCQ